MDFFKKLGHTLSPIKTNHVEFYSVAFPDVFFHSAVSHNEAILFLIKLGWKLMIVVHIGQTHIFFSANKTNKIGLN